MRILPITFLASVTAVLALGSLGVACGSGSSGSHETSSSDSGPEVSTGPSPESGSGDDGGAAEAAAPEAAGYPAILPTDIPQIVTHSTNGVIALPKVVPVFFASDDPTMTASIQDFVNKLGATQYWGVTKEYGVGPLTGEPAIQLTAADDPPLLYSENDIDTWINDKLNSGDPAWGTPDSNTIYALFFPGNVTITEGPTSSDYPGDGGVYPEGGAADLDAGGYAESCSEFGGYHSAVQLTNGTPVAYAVVPRCASFDGLTGIDAVTGGASHELGEAATDPFNEGYRGTDPADSYWGTLMSGGGEVGDMCAQNLGSFVKFSELPYLVQRLWSNKAAMTGLDPCVPVPAGEVYFNSFPVMPDTLQAQGRGADGGTTVVPTLGAQIAVGSSKTVELDLFSTAPTAGAWNVKLYDEYDLGLASAQQLTFAVAPANGQNGDQIALTITVKAAGKRNTEPFLIVSTLKNGSQNLWAGVVGQ